MATNEKQDPENTETAAATSYGQSDGGRTHESQKDKKFLEKKGQTKRKRDKVTQKRRETMTPANKTELPALENMAGVGVSI